MQALNILVWAVALGIVNVSAAVLIVALALAMCLWPGRSGTRARMAVNGQQGRIVAHFRRLLSTRKHPKHPTVEVEK